MICLYLDIVEITLNPLPPFLFSSTPIPHFLKPKIQSNKLYIMFYCRQKSASTVLDCLEKFGFGLDPRPSLDKVQILTNLCSGWLPSPALVVSYPDLLTFMLQRHFRAETRDNKIKRCSWTYSFSCTFLICSEINSFEWQGVISIV